MLQHTGYCVLRGLMIDPIPPAPFPGWVNLIGRNNYYGRRKEEAAHVE
jgi:hypothetical protein